MRGMCIRSASWISFAMRAIFSASSPMRSRSVMVLMTAMISRRSLAAGWRRAMMWLHASSSSTSIAFTRWSFSLMRSISAMFAGVERIDRAADLLLDETAHLQDAGADRLQLDVELLRSVLGHVHRLQDPVQDSAG